MSEEITIEKRIDGPKGRYVATVEGRQGNAELTFSIASPALVIADHTGADDSLRGTGVARLLVERLVEDARSEGFKIVPLCPYVNAQRRKHAEWAELFQV